MESCARGPAAAPERGDARMSAPKFTGKSGARVKGEGGEKEGKKYVSLGNYAGAFTNVSLGFHCRPVPCRGSFRRSSPSIYWDLRRNDTIIIGGVDVIALIETSAVDHSGLSRSASRITRDGRLMKFLRRKRTDGIRDEVFFPGNSLLMEYDLFDS